MAKHGASNTAAPHLPQRLGVNALVGILNSIGDYDMYKDVIKSL